jgi:hypothetical protein
MVRKMEARSVTEHVVRFEKLVNRIKPLRFRGVLRYGLIQVVLPKDFVDRPAFVVVYVFREKPYQLTSLEKVV